MLGHILAVVLALQSAQVAVIYDPDKPPIYMNRAEAELKFQRLCGHDTNPHMLTALALALDKTLDGADYNMNKHTSVCRPACAQNQRP